MESHISPGASSSSSDLRDSNNLKVGEKLSINAHNDQTISYDQTEFSFGSFTHSPEAQEAFRRELKYFFMNPIDKWRSKKKIPWKILFQMLKLIIVTMQVYSIGTEMSRFINNQVKLKITFSELLLDNWDRIREITTYPPAIGANAIYKKEDLYASIDYAIKEFSKVTESGLGSIAYDSKRIDEVSPIHLYIKRYVTGQANPYNFTYNYDSDVVVDNLTISSIYPAGDPHWENFSVKDFLEDSHSSIDFGSMIEMRMKMNLRTIYLDEIENYIQPKCYLLQIIITYNNKFHDGQVIVDLSVKSHRLHCKHDQHGTFEVWTESKEILSISVVIICFLSAFLCVRSLLKAQVLKRRSIRFFDSYYKLSLSYADRREFIDVWIIIILIDDILLITGSMIKLCMTIDYSAASTDAYSFLNGIGILLTWFGLLRYISFFDRFNVIILTVKKAFPDIVKFTMCALLLFIGFSLCGWIVLGPHHMKFRSPSETFECLFSLLNGDDMFATFFVLDTKNTVVWYFSRIYLYVFTSLFIYVVLSLFISIIVDAWDSIKPKSENAPHTDLHKFLSECSGDICDEIYQDERQKPFYHRIMSLFKPGEQHSALL